jgi:hypothetical protein
MVTSTGFTSKLSGFSSIVTMSSFETPSCFI